MRNFKKIRQINKSTNEFWNSKKKETKLSDFSKHGKKQMKKLYNSCTKNPKLPPLPKPYYKHKQYGPICPKHKTKIYLKQFKEKEAELWCGQCKGKPPGIDIGVIND